jgi:hypothetical protein
MQGTEPPRLDRDRVQARQPDASSVAAGDRYTPPALRRYMAIKTRSGGRLKLPPRSRASAAILPFGSGPQPVGLYIAALAARAGCDAATVAGMVRDATATDRRPPL